jgi:hypothetical protein
MIIDLLRELNELDEHPTLEAKACASGEQATLEATHASLASGHTTLRDSFPEDSRQSSFSTSEIHA